MRRFDDEDLTGAQFREGDLSGARLVGVVMQDAEIDGLVTNLVVNGVEVMASVEAETEGSEHRGVDGEWSMVETCVTWRHWSGIEKRASGLVPSVGEG